MAAHHLFELGTDGPKVILVGVDGSDTSMRAGAYAWGLARRSGAQLVVVRVGGASGMVSAVPGGRALLEETDQQIATNLAAELEKAAQESPVRYAFVQEQGDPYAVLARVADERKADAVIVGASAQAGHRLIGSVAVRLVRTGRWPVTVVP